MAVALTVTPALASSCCATRRSNAHESPLVGWLQRALHGGAGARSWPGRGVAYAAAGVLIAGRRRWCCRSSASRCSRTFKERDFLMHWITKPGTSLAEERTDHHPGQHGAAGHPGRAQTSARTSGRRSWPKRSPASTSARTGSASTRTPTTTRPWPQIQTVVDSYPGLCRDVQTYLDGAHRRGAHRRRASPIVVRIFGDDLADAARQGRRGARTCSRDIAGVIDATVELQADVPADPGRRSTCRPRSATA